MRHYSDNPGRVAAPRKGGDGPVRQKPVPPSGHSAANAAPKKMNRIVQKFDFNQGNWMHKHIFFYNNMMRE
jgi:hypothetical protein